MRKSCSGWIWFIHTHLKPFKQSTFFTIFILHYQAEKFVYLINAVAHSSWFPLGSGERLLRWTEAFYRELTVN